MSTRSSFPHKTNNERHHYDRDQVAKLVQEEEWRQTRFMALAPISRTSNSVMPSSRDRRTRDGLPICNKCDKVSHIARNCRAGDLKHHFQLGPKYKSYIRPDMRHQPPRVPQHHLYVRPVYSTTYKSVTMLQHSFLNTGVPVAIHFNRSRETSRAASLYRATSQARIFITLEARKTPAYRWSHDCSFPPKSWGKLN
jgi:hypothetical protein